MTQAPRRFALIPCAGTGSRAGEGVAKQYRPVAGTPMLLHALRVLTHSTLIDATLLVVAPEDRIWSDCLTDEVRRGLPGLRVLACGGASRHQSVLNGLQALLEIGAGSDDWVLVHDAARPGLTTELLARLIDAVGEDDNGGLLALPVPDTLKRESDAASVEVRRIAVTEPRDGLWQAQTPQMFRIGLLRKALQQALDAHAVVTDEASAIERLGLAPRLVRGSLRNFKVTYPDDFALATAILETQK